MVPTTNNHITEILKQPTLDKSVEINQNDSEYSETLTFNKNNYVDANVNNNVNNNANINNDDNSIVHTCDEDDDDDNLIFNNGQCGHLQYGILSDDEIKRKIDELKNDLNNNSNDTIDTVKIDTEFIKNSNPLITSVIAELLNDISNKSNNATFDESRIENKIIEIDTTDISQFNLNNDNFGEQHIIGVNTTDVSQSNLNGDNIDEQHNIESCDDNKMVFSEHSNNTENNILHEHEIEIEPNDDAINYSRVNICVNVNKENKNDEEKTKKLYEKYNKMNKDILKILCHEKNIKLSENKNQKKKNELINELIQLELNNM